MPETMFHLSLNVSDLNRSVEFYRRALGTEPTKHYPDYAKFELSDPPLVLSLEPGRADGQDRLNHLGIRVAHPEALRAFAEKAHASGLEPQYLQSVECCYSRQTKLCLSDPDENLVEIYLLEADLDKPSAKATMSEPAKAQGAPVTWEHLLGSAFPDRIPLDDSTAQEVRLRGTFNLRRPEAEAMQILSEARRVLAPEGELMVHLLVSDRELTKKLPRLPGPAALVEHTPTEPELVARLEKAGFHAILVKRLSHSSVFQFDGASMRELMLTARSKPKEISSGEQVVVYKGPFKTLTDDFGQTYQRGTRTIVTAEVFSALKAPQLKEHFVFLNETPAACGAPARPESSRPLEATP